jgi:hypothetical protein
MYFSKMEDFIMAKQAKAKTAVKEVVGTFY